MLLEARRYEPFKVARRCRCPPFSLFTPAKKNPSLFACQGRAHVLKRQEATEITEVFSHLLGGQLYAFAVFKSVWNDA